MDPLDRHGTTNVSRRGRAVTDAKKRLRRGKAGRGAMKALWPRRRRTISRVWVVQATVLVSAM